MLRLRLALLVALVGSVPAVNAAVPAPPPAAAGAETVAPTRAEFDALALRVGRHAPGDDPATLATFLRLVEAPGRDEPTQRVLVAGLTATFTQLSRDGTGTPAGWATLARALPFVASADLIPALSSAVAETNFTDAALDALSRLESPAADSAISALLDHPTPGVRSAALAAAGRRQIADALPAMSKLAANSADPDLADAALFALADLGSPAALESLEKLRLVVTPDRHSAVDRIRLQIARDLAATGRRESALPTLRSLSAPHPDADPFLRAGALRLQLDPTAADYTTALASMLGSDDTAAQDVALGALRNDPPADAVASLLPNLPESITLRALDALVTARADDVASFARTALGSPNAALALAAAQALGSVGDATHAPVLLEALTASASDDLRAECTAALIRLDGGTATNLTIFQAFSALSSRAASTTGPVLVRILAARGATEHKAALLDLLPSSATPRPLRTAILRSLEQFGSVEDVPVLLAQLDGAAPALASALEQALTIQLQRAVASLDADALVADLLPNASPAYASSLLRLSAAIATPASLARVEQAAGGENAALRPVAIRLLAAWSDPSALPALLGLLETSSAVLADSEVPRIVILRGVARLLVHPDLPAGEKLGTLRRLPALLQTDEEKNLASPLLLAPAA